jgi:hypothetical protein
MLLLAWFGIEVATVGVATLSVGSITSCRGAEAHLLYIYGIFCWRRDNRGRHARRGFFSVVSCGIPRLICAKDGILCRRRNAYRWDSRLGFVFVMSYVIPRVKYRRVL